MNLEEVSRQKKRSAYMWLSLNDFLRMLFILRDSVKNECISRKTQSYKLISKHYFLCMESTTMNRLGKSGSDILSDMN